MEYALLIFSVLFGALRNIFAKVVKKEKETFYQVLKTNVITFVFAFVAVFFIGISDIKTIFRVPWGIAFVYAICILGFQFTLLKSVELGSVSLSTLFHSCGFIIPTLFGSIRYKEEINALHIVGLILIIVSFACSVKKEEGKKFNIGWLFAALG